MKYLHRQMNMIFKRDQMKTLKLKRQHWGHSTIIERIESKKLIEVEFIRADALAARTENKSFWLHTIQNI